MTTVTSTQCMIKYGDPYLLATQAKHFTVWVTPENIRTAFKHVYFSQAGTIGFPKKIFINKDFQPILEKALNNLIDKGLAHELKTWDGCFMLRTKRGLNSLSIHCWANAVDVNRAENDLNMTPKLTPEFVKCFTDAGAEWGGTWKRKDGMHFQIAKIQTLSLL